MLIGGVEKTSLLDYPGKISTIIFTIGCDLRCKFCYNHNLVLPETIKSNNIIDIESLILYLKKRDGLIDALSICGGEPTLQYDLEDFCRRIKKETKLLIKLDTNGGNFVKVKNLIEDKLIDYLAIDFKINLNKNEDFQKILGISNIDQIKQFKTNYLLLLDYLKNMNKKGFKYEYRTTLIRGLYNIEDFLEMIKPLKGIDNYYLQNYLNGSVTIGEILGEKIKYGSFSENELKKFRDIAKKYLKVTNQIIR